MNNVFFNDSSVRHRTKGVGMIPEKDAYDLGAVGPTGRGSGIAAGCTNAWIWSI